MKTVYIVASHESYGGTEIAHDFSKDAFLPMEVCKIFKDFKRNNKIEKHGEIKTEFTVADSLFGLNYPYFHIIKPNTGFYVVAKPKKEMHFEQKVIITTENIDVFYYVKESNLKLATDNAYTSFCRPDPWMFCGDINLNWYKCVYPEKCIGLYNVNCKTEK